LSLDGVALCLVALVSLLCTGESRSQPVSPSPPPAANRNATDRQWFEDAKFGLAIRWGLYSLLDKDEWVMEHDKLPITQYGKLLSRLNAPRFDAGLWVKMAKAAGARYLTVATKHHDGFCMFATELTTYDIVDATPQHTDPIKALADASHQQGIKLFFYYSLLDWHHPDYFPLGKTGQSAGREAKGRWERYIAYCQGQIRELCTNYGEVGGFWLDGCWDRPEADWQLSGTYRLIHELQPRALVANDHRTAAMAGEDFRIVKLNPAGEDRSRLGKLTAPSELPLEIRWPINDAWSHGAAEPKNLNAEQVVHALVGAAGAGANFTLELRALPDGSLAPELTKTLEDVGKWLTTFGQSVYGTRRGPIPPQPWGFSTARGSSGHLKEIYLHILPSREDVPVVFDPSISWVPCLFGKKNPLKLTRSGRGLNLDLPPSDRLPIDTIVTLTPRPAGPSPKAN
jgi:alpha-L-fucosidase